jgi:hypothetical protein
MSISRLHTTGEPEIPAGCVTPPCVQYIVNSQTKPPSLISDSCEMLPSEAARSPAPALRASR